MLVHPFSVYVTVNVVVEVSKVVIEEVLALPGNQR
jgi:hypothetical protein